ncbi:related to Chromatin-remodeling complexes subunit NGG1 [Saccharomycodes ludwigii]|uniref:Related to Chromatin-remodeling complexes subunit NGG1 n=1 Tax=Saccharomycodes ludwigii TaxID=36035 RepID=A0A376B7T3_9ASCO|nr:hypothetical protein SCDLUD_001848 [Saccharomycodes ludwigii]KAH3902037.1 hypothetical protein SCDLUD_001848 [Saccharomycodes ludwigii]SSD60735.1 related to Chromatin-remodeling complexes subunit NGG1 [Saccharomycodes ludwigii]
MPYIDDKNDKLPSIILGEILETIDLSFDKGIGMLNGTNVRSPPKDINSIIKVRDLVKDLLTTLDKITAKDNEELQVLSSSTDNKSGKKLADNRDSIEETTKTIDQKQQVNAEDDEEETIRTKTKRTFSGSNDNDHNVKNDDDDDDEEANVPVKRRMLNRDKIENDPSVKNPKSEFVISQTLPKAAALLGLFTENGLETTGEDYLKIKYAVASYPTNDLQEMLPGRMPDLDLSNPKPTNQIQFNTFLTYVENFFRQYTDNDIEFLKQKSIIPLSLRDTNYDPDITPYMIPKLGQLYTDKWFKEDNNNNIANITVPNMPKPESIFPRGSSDLLGNENLDSDKISCGPLVTRLVSAVLGSPDGIEFNQPIKKDDNEDSISQISAATTPPLQQEQLLNLDTKDQDNTATSLLFPIKWKLDDKLFSTPNLDYLTFEERLKKELKYLGIYSMANDNELDWLHTREDDEVSQELRKLQKNLKETQTRNIKRMKILVPIIQKKLAWQEYEQILDDLNKQIDQVYIKRIRAPKSKKKKHSSISNSNNSVADFGNSTSQAALQAAHQQAANSSLKVLLDKRSRWIEKIGPLFGDPELIKRIPKESIFHNLDDDKNGEEDEDVDLDAEDEEDDDVFHQAGNNKEELANQ